MDTSIRVQILDEAVWISLSANTYGFTNPTTRPGCDTKSIFKWSLTGLDSEFSFSNTSCLTKAEKKN